MPGLYCPTSKQPELKHAAVKVLKAELPWTLLAMAWLPADSAQAAADEHSITPQQLMAAGTAHPATTPTPTAAKSTATNIAALPAPAAGSTTAAQPSDSMLQAIDAELQTKMGELKDDAAKEALKKTYDEMKNTKAQEMAPQFQEMQKAKADALKAAQEAQAKADAELKAEEEAALKACVDKATKDRMGKAKADCQIAAKKFEDFQKCK